jgi:hypothetical protein
MTKTPTSRKAAKSLNLAQVRFATNCTAGAEGGLYFWLIPVTGAYVVVATLRAPIRVNTLSVLMAFWMRRLTPMLSAHTGPNTRTRIPE